MRKIRNRSGSALVLTVLMVSILSTVSFSITALSISELRKATALEDSITAFYAAESGIEHALLQYRMSRNAEISQEMNDYIRKDGSLPVPEPIVPTKTAGKPLWFQVTGSKPGVITAGEDKGRAYYGLKMYYKGGAIGRVDESGKPVVDDVLSPKIYRDSALPISTSGADELWIAWSMDDETKSRINNGTQPLLQNGWYLFLEISAYNPRASATKECLPIKRRTYHVDDRNWRQFSSREMDRFELQGCDYETVKIKPWGMGYARYSAVTVNSDRQPMKFDSGYQSIVSVGVSGKAKRELRVNLSRSNKTVLEAEDFLFISGGDDLDL